MSGDGPTLGVVVPTLNEAECLPRLLAFLQSERPDELIVVDGGSTDGTRELAREGGARVEWAERGRGTQMAAGARLSSSDLLLFLHADNCPDAGALSSLRRAFAEQPELVAAGMSQRIEGSAGLYRWIEKAADRRVRRGQVYGDSGLCVRRSVYESVGGFGALPLFEDVDLSRRLRREGEIALVPAARLRVSARRWERTGIVATTLRNWMLRAAFALGVEPERLMRYYRPHGATKP